MMFVLDLNPSYQIGMWKTRDAPVSYPMKVHLCAKFTFELYQNHGVDVREAFDIQC